MKTRALLASLLFCVCFLAHASSQEVSVSPSQWGDGEVERYLKVMKTMPAPNPLVTGKQGAITGTYNAAAMRAGFESLKQGGSAVDAALTTANAQIVLCGGGWVSYTGILTMVYYDAATGEIYNLNAAYNTVLGEEKPMSIPGNPNMMNDMYGGTPSGRTALVPGYVAGVEAAHKKFGKLPFRCLFEPAIYFAENGFDITPYFAAIMKKREDVLTRLPEIKSVFCDSSGEPLKPGDKLIQKELAKTLKQISQHGADYMYRGPWTKRFVDAVQAEGGKITAQDMDQYKPIWSKPARGNYRDYEIVSHGLPAVGGVNTIEAMRLFELSGLKDKGVYWKSPESLFWIAQFHRVMSLGFIPSDLVKSLGDSIDTDLSAESRLNPKTTQILFKAMQDGKFAFAQKPLEGEQQENMAPKHSDAVVAVDKFGNVCSIVHSINAVMWGKTGIFVDGISVNDSASFQQTQIAQVKPGSRLPDPTNPTLVLNADGKPILVCSAMGSGLHQKTNQCLINVLDFGMNPKEADEAPYLMTPKYDGGNVIQRVIKGSINASVLEKTRAMGLAIEELEENSRFAQGLWVGIEIDPKSGQLKTASPAVTNGAAFAR